MVLGPGGTVRLKGEDEIEADAIALFLHGCSGANSMETLCRRSGLGLGQAQAIVAAVHDVGGIGDHRAVWRWFAAASANPPRFPAPMSPAEAYDIPRWQPDGSTMSRVPLPSPDAALGWSRPASLELGSVVVADPVWLRKTATSLIAETMRPSASGGMHFSSAGAMWPLQVWALLPSSAGRFTLNLVHHETDALLSGPTEPTSQEVKECFLRDDDLHAAIDAGAAIVVISADPRRMCGKYGDRGWNYILIETGQAIATLTRLAEPLRLGVRPIGGYLEQEVAALLGQPDLIPTCTLVVAGAQ